jgi:uncharacterized protein (TIGR02421 family)
MMGKIQAACATETNGDSLNEPPLSRAVLPVRRRTRPGIASISFPRLFHPAASPRRRLRRQAFPGPQIRELADRLSAAQRPLRILEAIRWDERVEQEFFAAGARRLPPVNRDWYHNRPLPFDPDTLREELRSLQREITRRVGRSHPAGRMMLRLCDESQQVVELLLHRGTPEFAHMAARLYGRREFSRKERSYLAGLASLTTTPAEETEPVFAATEVAEVLSGRLGAYFAASASIRVRLVANLLADASAASNCVKLRGAARFSQRDVRLLEVHEGWTHLGTTCNGREQSYCTFLGRCSPSATATQEGLAVLLEFLVSASCPLRFRRLMLRAAGVTLVEAGGNFLDAYHFFLDEGYTPAEAYQQSARIFRGSLPDGGGPFPKDACYLRGFLDVCAAARTCFATANADLLPLLFCGKTRVQDLPLLAELREEGLLLPARYLPPPFGNLPAMEAWLETAMLV